MLWVKLTGLLVVTILCAAAGERYCNRSAELERACHASDQYFPAMRDKLLRGERPTPEQQLAFERAARREWSLRYDLNHP